MGGARMKKRSQYDWLIVAEGNSDISVYNEYLDDDNIPLSFRIIGVGGKGYSLNMSSWDPKHIATLRNDSGRTGFKGVILVVDSDADAKTPFANYRRGDSLFYIDSIPPTPERDSTGSFWLLDSIKGIKPLPVKGINVPRADHGCLETELLSSYGFPTEPQTEYTSFVNIIKQATAEWKIPNNDDGKPWWEINEKAKFDKFIYAALRQGFKVCGKEPALPDEPDVIRNIRTAMQ
jgi:hypothetical protein